MKEKRLKKVRYWVVYRLANGKQRKEFVGLPDGRPARNRRGPGRGGQAQGPKVENPTILERVPAERMTFTELAEWYLDLSPVKKLASYAGSGRVRQFHREFGERIVSTLKPMDLEEYQEKREEDGRAPATVDMEISLVKTMVTKAFDNDLVDGRTVKAFRVVKRKLERRRNARHRTLTIEEFLKLVEVAPDHLKAILNHGIQYRHEDRRTPGLAMVTYRPGEMGYQTAGGRDQREPGQGDSD